MHINNALEGKIPSDTSPKLATEMIMMNVRSCNLTSHVTGAHGLKLYPSAKSNHEHLQ